jgi:hypothetical protein
MVDVDASNHTTLLSEKRASEVILHFCERFYQGQGRDVIPAN